MKKAILFKLFTKSVKCGLATRTEVKSASDNSIDRSIAHKKQIFPEVSVPVNSETNKRFKIQSPSRVKC